MAYILKANKTYTYKGLPVENPYLVIDALNTNKREKICHFTVEIYPSQAERNTLGMVLESFNYEVTGDEFDQYFAPSVIAADHDQYHQAYNYISEIRDNENVKIWDNWISDEVNS